MAVREMWVVIMYCDRCGSKTAVPSTQITDLPEGFHVHMLKIRKTSSGKEYSRTEAQYYCSKECFIAGIQYHNYQDVYFDPEDKHG